jgi:hypothetical protein
MTTLMNRSRTTLLALSLVGALGLGGMIGPSAANAAPANNCTYYSDATFTTVVGQFGYDCCNNRVARGIKTQFVQCSQACFLCTPPPPQ